MDEKRFMKGNEAIAEAAIRAGCMAYYGYPITPQNELAAYMAKNMPAHGRVFIQTESEIAAINAVFGSSAAGFRAMTSSAGTAMSLKQEGISQCAYLEMPAVVVDMMRGGPGMGNILSTQADYRQAKGGGSGDYQVIVLAPNSVQEAADLIGDAFALSEKYRGPVLLLGDGTIGQMMELVQFKPPLRMEDLPARDYALSGCRGRAPRKTRSHDTPADLEEFNIRLQRKYGVIQKTEPRSETYRCDDAEVVIVAFGSVSRIARELVEDARAQGCRLGLFRPITVWPFDRMALLAATKNARAVVTLEHNAGMMTHDVRFALSGRLPVYFHGRMGGAVIDGDVVYEKIRQVMDGQENKWREYDEQQGLWKTYQPE